MRSNGTENRIFNYGIVPRKGNRSCWSIGQPYDDGDVWTCPVTSKGFEQILVDYDYLFVAHSDDKFADQFAPLFGSGGVQDGGMFHILNENGLVRLQKI
jgi:hypothetical protein